MIGPDPAWVPISSDVRLLDDDKAERGEVENREYWHTKPENGVRFELVV
jgi:hypothetical protein